MSSLDVEKLRKVWELVKRGATEGERSAARARANTMAKRAGMTLEEALSRLDSMKAEPPPSDIFKGFDDWMEEREPGYKAREAAKRAERDARDAVKRAEVLERYGSEAKLFTLTAWEQALHDAIAPLATWDCWTDGNGTTRLYASTLDGKRPMFWSIKEITPAIREAVTAAYPWPSNLDSALQEVKAWDRLRWDRGLFCGEWNHFAEVECRVSLLEHELEEGRPAASWDDVQARFDWKRYRYESQWLDPTERDDPFLDRLEADFAILREQAHQTGEEQPRAVRRTNADKRAEVLSMLDRCPDLSDREIARRAGVSPQTVNTWRKKRMA